MTWGAAPEPCFAFEVGSGTICARCLHAFKEHARMLDYQWHPAGPFLAGVPAVVPANKELLLVSRQGPKRYYSLDEV